LKLLVDTQAALWLLAEDRRLPTTARRLVFDEDVDCFLSAAAVWEVAIKRSLGKLDAPADFHVYLKRHGIAGLPIYDRHAMLVADLPRHHGDPFDRLMVAQAIAEEMAILSIDKVMHAYDVQVLW
jgi:PIN domain nuclease of toxin-antitoxin system